MMNITRKSNLVINSFRNFISKNSIPINQTLTHHHHYHQFNPPNKLQPNFPQIPSFRRHYYVDRNQVHHFRPRGPEKWFQDRRKLLIVTVIGSGLLISVYFGNIETIPYTKRRHFVIFSTNAEKQMGENEFQNLKKSFKGKILPGIHPQSVRVRLIAKDVIEALQRGIEKETTVWSDHNNDHNPSYASGYGSEKSAEEVVMALVGETEGSMEGRDEWKKEEEVLDDKWVQQCRKKGKEKSLQVATKHLSGLNWEVLVVDEPVVNAFCLPGGKIVVFTGLLKHFKADAEIATIIGHEVAHAVARHAAEGMTKNIWVAIVQIVLLQFVSMPDLVSATSNLLLKLPFSRRMEMEADYIGLLLIASAGYDPRVAPTVYKKLGEVGGDSPLRDYLSTHPSGTKRAQVLAQAKVMEEALAIYREVQAGRLVHDFL